MASPRTANTTLFNKSEWLRLPKQGWIYSRDTDIWAIAGRCDESSVSFSFLFHSDNNCSRFMPLVHARKTDDRQHCQKHDSLILNNFDLERIIKLLHANKFISNETFNNFFKYAEYKEFVNSVKNEEYVNFGGTKDGTWLHIWDKDRLGILQVLENGSIIPQGFTAEYKLFMIEADPNKDQVYSNNGCPKLEEENRLAPPRV